MWVKLVSAATSVSVANSSAVITMLLLTPLCTKTMKESPAVMPEIAVPAAAPPGPERAIPAAGRTLVFDY